MELIKGTDDAESELEADFEATSELGVSEVRLGRLFDVVTVMFAIHYFFESEQSANAFFHNVAINLKDGELVEVDEFRIWDFRF